MRRWAVHWQRPRFRPTALTLALGLGAAALVQAGPGIAAAAGRLDWGDVGVGGLVAIVATAGVGLAVSLAGRLRRAGLLGRDVGLTVSCIAWLTLLSFPLIMLSAAVVLHSLTNPGAGYWLGAGLAAAAALAILVLHPGRRPEVVDPEAIETRFESLMRTSGLLR